MIIDISPALRATIAVWPGDQPLERQVALSFAGGDHLELSALRSTVHLGAHADAPSHYHAAGQAIEARSLSRYLGHAQVMHVPVARGERITPRHLTAAVTAPRLLLRTDSYPDPDVFNEDFAALSPELVQHLAALGVVLVGIDTPSVDLFADRALESHQALAANDLAVLEGLVLSATPDGHYTLIALPLPLVGFDASPVRAVLLPHPLPASLDAR